MACPIANCPMVRGSGVSSKPVCEEIEHSTKIWGNTESFQTMNVPIFFQWNVRVYLYFILKDFKEGTSDKKPIKSEICDI